uniref:Zgc:113229 n=1 Tax=Astyanax mexicanus TaxID=7994 RepID=A0A8B9K0G0_ASTMX
MAQSSPVSDTQTLLHSMLQRLKLQTQTERTHNQEQALSSNVKLNGGSGEGSAVYQFGDSIDSKQQRTSPSNWRHLGSPWSLQTSCEPHSPGTSPTSPEPVSWSMNDDDLPKWERKQLKFTLRKVSDDSRSMSSTNTLEQTTLNSPSSSVPPPTPPTPGRRASQERSGLSGVWNGGVGDSRRDSINAEDKMTQTPMTRTSKRKWGNSGQKRWTQKVKERWQERHKKERGAKQKEEPKEVPNSNHCPNTPTSPNTSNENALSTNTAAALIDEERIDQHQPINNGPDKAPPSPLDHMSEPIFSFDSFNLMEEIFTSQEWAKFFPSSTSSQSEPTCIKQDKATDSQSNISQSHQAEQNTGSMWDFKWPHASDLRTDSSQISSDSLQQDMDTSDHTSDHTIDQTKTPDFSLPFSQTFQFLKDQSELFDWSLDQSHSMDLGLSQSENDKQQKYQPQLLDMHQNCQPKTTETSSQESPSNQHTLNQSQLPKPNQTQAETVQHEDVIPLLDLSYLQPKDSGSHGTLSRKRGHCTLNGSSENGEVDRGRDNSIIPLYSLQPESSISSPQRSVSKDSESTASTETVVKKRRLEDTRRVHFAEEVTYLPHLVLNEDEGEDEEENYDYDNYNEDEDYDDDDDEDDDDDDDDDYDIDNGNDDNDTHGKVEANYHEEPQSRPSFPNWIVALRTKTKRKSKFKFPQMLSTPTKLKSSKSFI